MNEHAAAPDPSLAGLDLEALWLPFTHNRLFKREPRIVTGASGMYYTTGDGRRILDGLSGLWCCNAGHRHPKIVEAVVRQLGQLDYAPPFQTMHDKGFELATARMDEGDFSAALTEFESVYALLVGHPRQFFVLYNLGLCQRQLFQYERALASFRQYLSALSPNDPERTEVEATIAALVAQLATLHVESNREGARVWLDNREVGAVNTDLLVPSGAHVIEVRQPGFEMARREVSLASGETVHVVLSLDALGDVHGIDVAFFATSAALTGASLIATVVAGSLALARRGEVDTCLSNDACRFDRNFDLDRQAIGDLAGATDALLITTGVLGVTTFVLAFVTDFGGSTATETALRISPSGVSLTGSF